MSRGCIAVNEREENKGERKQNSYMAHREPVAQAAGHKRTFISCISKWGEILELCCSMRDHEC